MHARANSIACSDGSFGCRNTWFSAERRKVASSSSCANQRSYFGIAMIIARSLSKMSMKAASAMPLSRDSAALRM
jgi:hypothetical protein